jgi:hypothetical protein
MHLRCIKNYFVCAGVQIVGGVLSILSGVVLVLYFAKLDTLVEEKYYRVFGVSNIEETF